jgi:hypothetical protein
LINVPLILVNLWATREVPESRDPDAHGHFDWLGAAAIAVAVGGLAFGATRGEQAAWQDPIAWIALGVGAVGLVAVPILMLTRDRPLVPPSLFASRNFTVVNLSTLVIYGALYVQFAFVALFLQGTLGYSPLAAGIVGVPVAILLTTLSTPAGRWSARFGPRAFMAIGPLIMAAGLLWFARVPATSPTWVLDVGDPPSWLPPVGVLTDVLLAQAIFGVGIALLVAPLTTALMSSVPVRNAGLGSAINNAVSRVGSPLVSAALFVVITASFYPTLAALVPGVDVNDPALRERIQPLTRPMDGTDPVLAEAARQASTDAFRLAMLVAAALLAAGAAVNAVGIRNPPREAVTDPPGGPVG